MSNVTEFYHILVIEDEKSRRIVYLEDEIYTIGRDSSNSIVIYERQVSRFHAILQREIDNKNHVVYRIKDGDIKGNISTNGLIVNGKPSLSHELKHGDIIRFGGQAKVIYNIISDNYVISLFKNGEVRENSVRSKSTLNTEEYKTTLRTNKDFEELTQEELFRLASFPELSPNPIIEIDWDGKITYLNPAASLKFKDIDISKNQHPILAGLLSNCQSKNGSLFVREVKIGSEIFEQYVHYLAETKLIRSYIFDYTKRKQIEASLRESQELYRSLVRQSSEGIFMVEAANKRIVETNNTFCNISGYSLEETLGMSLSDLIVKPENLEQYIQRLAGNSELFIEATHKKKDGSLIKLNLNTTFINYGGRDIICFAVKNIAPEQLNVNSEYQGLHDPVTGLVNPTLFNEYLSTILANAKTHQHIMGLMLLNINNFDQITNSLGEEIGDQLLKNFAQRLRYCLRSGDIVASRERNEFAVILPKIQSVKDVAKIAQRLLNVVELPFEIYDQKIDVTTNIGVGLYPQDAEDVQTLIKNADFALSRTKELGGNNYQFFSPTITSNASRLLRLENLIDEALKNEEFALYYQPIVNINTGDLTGMEAFLRWQHPELERVSPEQLVSIAEESELIIPLTEWILNTACSQNKAWQQEGLSPLPVAVNISSREFKQPNLLATITQALNNTGLEARWLELEITEKAIMDNSELLPKIMRQLLQLGLKISIDDFGTGYCSLNYLKKFPFHTLKIDQSFVKDLKDNPQDTAIISAMIALGRSFNMRIVAEGVERQQQLELLRRLQCEEIQGYLFSHPLSPEDATNFIRRAQK